MVRGAAVRRSHRVLWIAALAGSLVTTPSQAGPADGFSSDNVEFVANIPFSQGTFPSAISARLLGRYLYVRGVDSLQIYDVADPLQPEVLGGVTIPLHPSPHGVEDADTNGRIFLLPTCCANDGSGELFVVDVRDKTNPQVMGMITGANAHTATCIRDCRWAYAGSGAIVDLRDPSRPRVLAKKWSDGLQTVNPPGFVDGVAHDVTEVRPGLILTAGTPMYLLDARKSVVRPRVVARSDGSPHSFGGTYWPNGGKNDIALSWSESYQPPRCEIRDAQRGTSFDSAFKTWDASEWRETGLIFGRDEFYIANGTHTDGEPVFSGGPPGIAGCSASWFDVHPDFGRTGGFVALAATGHGTKLLDVDTNGQIEQVGWFLPHYGNAVSAYWLTKEIVFVMDAYRGIDILRFDRSRV